MGSSSSKTVQQPQQPVTSGDPLKDAFDAFNSNKNNEMLNKLEVAFKNKRYSLEKEISDLRAKIQTLESNNSTISRLLQNDTFRPAHQIISSDDFGKMNDDQKTMALRQFIDEINGVVSNMKVGGRSKSKKANKKAKTSSAWRAMPKKKAVVPKKKIAPKSKKNAGKQSK
jgi:hypothetical protein